MLSFVNIWRAPHGAEGSAFLSPCVAGKAVTGICVMVVSRCHEGADGASPLEGSEGA